MIRLLRSPSPSPAATANGWQILTSRLRERLHRVLNRLGVPGAVQPMQLHDAVTGRTITVRVGLYYTVVTVDGRDYYFDRITGRFDGTGALV